MFIYRYHNYHGFVAFLLRDCIALERLPKNIGELSKLKCLDLYAQVDLENVLWQFPSQLQALFLQPLSHGKIKTNVII